MCLDCGCGHVNDTHGDDRHITMTDIKNAAEASNTTPEQVVARISRQVTPHAAPAARADAPVNISDDSDMDAFSPVCTFCYWWKPADGHYCGAWPPGGSKKIPDNIWRGDNMHITPVGGEKSNDGKPIVFRPAANVKRTSENAALLDAYQKARTNQK